MVWKAPSAEPWLPGSPRIAKLVEGGVLEKRPYQDNPVRYEYHLTEKGRHLWPVLTMMPQWGDKHAAPNGPPMIVTHKTCGHASPLELHCTSCGACVTSRDVSAQPAASRRKDKSAR